MGAFFVGAGLTNTAEFNVSTGVLGLLLPPNKDENAEYAMTNASPAPIIFMEFSPSSNSDSDAAEFGGVKKRY